MKQDVFVQRPDAAQHPRPFHRPRSSVNRVGGSGGRTGAVRRGWPSGAGIDGSGVDMSEPLRALRDASAPVWRRGGIPIFVSDALNAARGNDILQRVKSGINWSKETWARPTEEECHSYHSGYRYNTLPTPKSACFSMYTRELKVRVVLGRASRKWCVLQGTLEGITCLGLGLGFRVRV